MMDFKQYEMQIRSKQIQKANDSKVTLGDIDALVGKINTNVKADVSLPKYDLESFNKRLQTYRDDLVSSDVKKSDDAVEEMHTILNNMKMQAKAENNKAKVKQVKKAEKIVLKEEDIARKIIQKEEERLRELARKQQEEFKALAKEQNEEFKAQKAKLEVELKHVQRERTKLENERNEFAHISNFIKNAIVPNSHNEDEHEQNGQEMHESLINELKDVVSKERKTVKTTEVKNSETTQPAIVNETKPVEEKPVVEPHVVRTPETIAALSQQRRIITMKEFERKGTNKTVVVIALVAVIAIAIFGFIYLKK